MRIGELAERAGVSPRTIDYYTHLGLFQEVGRSPGKHRLYSEEALKTIKMIKELQKQHYSLEEICSLFVGKEDPKILEKVVNIQKNLDSLQKEVAELYPIFQLNGQNLQFKAAFQELLSKRVQVIQALLILLIDAGI